MTCAHTHTHTYEHVVIEERTKMVRSLVENTGCERLPLACEYKDKECSVYSCDGTPLPGSPALRMSGTNTLNLEEYDLAGGTKIQKAKADKKYLGVRVKMPVRDMLRNIRIAKGMDPNDLQKKENKTSKGDKKRVNMSGDRKKRLKKWQTKSLEELAFIVEVLEEDLKTSTSRQRSKHLSSTFSLDQGNKLWCRNFTQQGLTDESLATLGCCAAAKKNALQPTEIYSYFPCCAYSQDFFSDIPVECSSGESHYYMYMDHHGMTCFPSNSGAQVYSPLERLNFSPKFSYWRDSSHADTCSSSVQEGFNNTACFSIQTEREEHLLRGFPDQEFLAVNENGRTLLHRAVDEGKRVHVYVIGKRMAVLKKLDTKDSEGMTSLHLAAQKNQHLMVADLISLGANINERDNYGKTCLHISAQYGHVRVLEVLKSCMRNGTYIDLEARDTNGLSALQVASVALKSTVGELERSLTVGQARLHSLRKEQMMETLKCLLQMECNLQCLK